MNLMNTKKLKSEVEKIVAESSFCIRKDVFKLLKKAYRLEKKLKPKNALKLIIDNAVIAKKKSLAICQDTGLPIIFLEVGKNISVNSKIIEAIKLSVERAYKKNYLRPSIVDAVKRGKSSYTGALLHIDFVSDLKGMKIALLPKGFGCENKSQLRMFNPTVDISEIEDFIISVVKKAGPEACPPFVVGVGIGGTSDTALLLAKKAFLGRIDCLNKDKDLRLMEKRLLKRVNLLKIGPMGLGGSTTALAVKIAKAQTHIAGLPVGVNISCHALRSAFINIKL